MIDKAYDGLKRVRATSIEDLTVPSIDKTSTDCAQSDMTLASVLTRIATISDDATKLVSASPTTKILSEDDPLVSMNIETTSDQKESPQASNDDLDDIISTLLPSTDKQEAEAESTAVVRSSKRNKLKPLLLVQRNEQRQGQCSDTRG